MSPASLEYNRYNKVRSAGEEAVRLSETLLQSYPVTRACLGILGKRLLNQLEYGFFTSNTTIILQGDTGKDLFLLCNGTVDVLVDNRRVILMEAPELFGDKGIVEPKSTRSATIRVTDDQTCFFLKIPLGLFIRNFNDKKIPDDEFSQEIGIFYNMFKGIQNRLFEYVFVQKKLWEEVNTTLLLVNTQQILKQLDNRIDQNWDPRIWESVRTSLKSELNFKWPDESPLNISTFRGILQEHLNKTFPREKFKGKDTEYIKAKHRLWRDWMSMISKVIIRQLPSERLPVNIGEIQLFNPRNYQVRIQGLIRAIEKKFLLNKKKSLEADNPQETARASEIKRFFGRSESDNTFDLKRYLSSFERKFDLKYPNRMQTQIAQRTALVAAKCENEFNASVAAMKEFLNKTTQTISSAYSTKSSLLKKPANINRELVQLSACFIAYNNRVKPKIREEIGETRFNPTFTPTIVDLMRHAASKQIVASLRRCFASILKTLNIQSGTLPLSVITSNFHICDASPGFEIPSRELENHYWIPLSTGIHLKGGEEDYGMIKPGHLIGGKGWMHRASTPDGERVDTWKLKMPERTPNDPVQKSYFLFVLPNQKLPWEENMDANNGEFVKTHLPVMQWLIDKQIEHLSALLPKRDALFQKRVHIEQVVIAEKRVKEFENNAKNIDPAQIKSIHELLNNMMGLTLDQETSLTTSQLSKKIYNFLLKQMMVDYSDIPMERLGNKTYTKWRSILSEIIQTLDQSDGNEKVRTATPVFEIIESELLVMLENFNLASCDKYIQLADEPPSIQFSKIWAALENPEQDQTLLFLLTQSILETYLRLLIEEIHEHKTCYDKNSEERPSSDVETLQTQEILEAGKKLISIASRQSQKIGQKVDPDP
jgi:hypothetical protein